MLLIRHGQTDWNKAGRWQGHIDRPLNETGKEQARLIAERLNKWPIDAIVSSDLKRAHNTAKFIAAKHGLAIETDPIWRERNIGEFGGLTSDEAKAQFAEVWERSVNGRLEPPNGESFTDLRARAKKAFEQALSQYAHQMVAIVSHGQLIHVILGQVMGIKDDEYGRFSIRGNTSLNIVEIDKTPIVTRVNDIAHLE